MGADGGGLPFGESGSGLGEKAALGQPLPLGGRGCGDKALGEKFGTQPLGTVQPPAGGLVTKWPWKNPVTVWGSGRTRKGAGCWRSMAALTARGPASGRSSGAPQGRASSFKGIFKREPRQSHTSQALGRTPPVGAKRSLPEPLRGPLPPNVYPIP
jgi:hypothetical protein